MGSIRVGLRGIQGELYLRTVSRRARSRFRRLIGRHPLTYVPTLAFRPKARALIVRRTTELVIEGYPRSANTFAVAAFEYAQQRSVRIARHLHMPSQVVRGVRRSLPVLILVRHPEDAIASLLLRHPMILPDQALRDYIWFYECVWPYRHAVQVASFGEVTTDFGQVIRRMNTKFGSDYAIFLHTPENVREVFRLVDAMDRSDTGRASVTESSVARPSRTRQLQQEVIRRELRGGNLRDLMKQAVRWYERYLAEEEQEAQSTEARLVFRS